MHNCSLDKLTPGMKGIISSLTCNGALRRKLMDMGFTPGTEIYVEGTAPLKDPIIVCVRGCRLGLRKKEAASVMIREQQLAYAPGHRRRFRGQVQHKVS
ncbi:MAG TPA: ferrous iron transport protein A [Firmicutes bacterium]|nr:ferrous iron transport protein A [Bacillota bacterium]